MKRQFVRDFCSKDERVRFKQLMQRLPEDAKFYKCEASQESLPDADEFKEYELTVTDLLGHCKLLGDKKQFKELRTGRFISENGIRELTVASGLCKLKILNTQLRAFKAMGQTDLES